MNPETLNSIHDRVFKGSMKRIAIAQGLSQLLLPERISFKIDYNSLHIEKESGINSRLLQHPSDVLYSAKIEGTGQRVLLVESRSFCAFKCQYIFALAHSLPRLFPLKFLLTRRRGVRGESEQKTYLVLITANQTIYNVI